MSDNSDPFDGWEIGPCSECGERFDDVLRAIDHQRVMHPESIDREAGKAVMREALRARRPRYMVCAWCTQRFVMVPDSFYDLRGHQRIAHPLEVAQLGLDDRVVIEGELEDDE